MNITEIKYSLVLLTIMSVFLLAGCKGQKTDEDIQFMTLEGEGTVLATVNGSPITQYELEQTIDTTIGQKNASKIGAEGRKKVLESLAASRAIALKSEKQLSPEERAELEKKTQAYREQLLVKKYISKNITPEPVTQEMVKSYYNEHPEKFGAEILRSYEMISTSRNLKQTERDALLKLLVSPEKQSDWKSWAKIIEKKGLPVFYKDGPVIEKLLHPKLNAIMKNLKTGEASSLSFIDERPYLVRITNEEATPPRPLSEVSTQIRKSLGPVQFKKAVKQASAEALKESTVVYK